MLTENSVLTILRMKRWQRVVVVIALVFGVMMRLCSFQTRAGTYTVSSPAA